MKKPRILFWDLETSPNLVAAFQLKNIAPLPYQGIQQERYVICGSYKWAGNSKVHSVVVNSRKPKDDSTILRKLSKVIAKADAIIAHYGDNFDMKFIRTRLAHHNLPGLPPVKQIDTCKMANKNFLFNSNSLDYLGQYLGVGRKIKVGYEVWDGCMKGDRKSLDFMVKYNKQDVILLEKVYDRLVVFDRSPVNMRLFGGNCRHCGDSHLQYRGYYVTRTKRSRRLQCQDCGKWDVD